MSQKFWIVVFAYKYLKDTIDEFDPVDTLENGNYDDIQVAAKTVEEAVEKATWKLFGEWWDVSEYIDEDFFAAACEGHFVDGEAITESPWQKFIICVEQKFVLKERE